MARPRKRERPLVVLGIKSDPDCVRGILEVAREQNWRLFDLNISMGRLPRDLLPVGAILNSLPDDPTVAYLQNIGCQCVRRGNYPHPMDGKLPAVIPDTHAIGRMAAEHFASRGFKHVGYCINEPRDDIDLKLDGFQDQSAKLGMEFHLLRKPRVGSVEAYEGLLQDWLRNMPKPVGVLGYHDTMAVRMMLAAMAAGLLVPEQVAVLGARNSLQCETALVPLSAVEVDPGQLGRESALLLQRMMDGEEPPTHTLIPPKRVKVRQSTDVLAVADIAVAKALCYIWENFKWPLTVDDVADEAQVSRSTLERRFRKHLGRGVNAELRRKRLEKCGELLLGTDLTVAEVAELTGFRSRIYLHRAFQKEFGKTPAQFRRESKGDSAPMRPKCVIARQSTDAQIG